MRQTNMLNYRITQNVILGRVMLAISLLCILHTSSVVCKIDCHLRIIRKHNTAENYRPVASGGAGGALGHQFLAD